MIPKGKCEVVPTAGGGDVQGQGRVWLLLKHTSWFPLTPCRLCTGVPETLTVGEASSGELHEGCVAERGRLGDNSTAGLFTARSPTVATC